MKSILHALFFISFVSTYSYGSIKDSVGTKVADGKTWTIHKVEKGETLYSISKRYKVTVDQIKDWNSMKSNSLDIGQKINILSKSGTSTAKKTAKIHYVKKGESLYLLANKYKTTVKAIKKWNDLKSDNLNIGQRLIVSDGEEPIENKFDPKTTKHVVKSGETLYSIARKYRTSVEMIKKLNGVSNELKVGQTLLVSPEPKTLSNKPLEFKAESGTAGLLSDSKFANKYAYCYHKSAPIGTIIKVTNKKSGKFMYAKVMGRSSNNLINVNQTVMQKIGDLSNTFEAELKYVQ